jgi:glycosyltransferase involved in cell wall biosynthesis
VDDGSSDATLERLAALNDDRLRILPLEHNRGANLARNRGIDKARGEFIAFSG